MAGPLDQLQPCPFCGHPAEHEPWHGGGPLKVMIGCSGRRDGCLVGPMVTGETPDEAAANWNRRAPRPPLFQVADALDCFWNAALYATHEAQDSTANAVMSGMVQGVAAVAERLREHARCSPSLVDALKRAEAFMAGFEGDELQEGIAERLAAVRAAITQAEAR